MKFSDIYKKGYGKPDTTDIIVGGMAIDIKDKKVYSHAEDGTIFQVGLNTEQVNEIIEDLTFLPPIGSIIMYAGQLANLPINWSVCNGSNGTPDLRDKFVYGTNVQGEINTKGGSADSVNVSHSHTTAAHNHTGSTGSNGAHAHDLKAGSELGGGGLPLSAKTTTFNMRGAALSNGAHTHSVSIGNKTVTVHSSGTSGTGKNIPPYVKLAYIMRQS